MNSDIETKTGEVKTSLSKQIIDNLKKNYLNKKFSYLLFNKLLQKLNDVLWGFCNGLFTGAILFNGYSMFSVLCQIYGSFCGGFVGILISIFGNRQSTNFFFEQYKKP